MSKRIVEEAPQKGSHAQGADKLQKQASQLAYDVKYKVKQSLGKDTKLNPAQVAKAYLSQLTKSPAPPAVKALAKKKLMGEEYTSDVATLAEKAMVNAMVKVFVEGVSVEHVEVEQIQEEEKQYKIRVTDKKTGNTYVRTATRAKIAELRANPNISSVEMTGYGEVSSDEKSKGAKTAKAKAGKGLDPVGQEDKDVDNDGDHDKSDKYLLKRRKAVGKAIATRKEEVETVNEIHSSAHTPHEVPDRDLKKLVKKAVKRIDADVDGDVDKNDPKAGDYGEFVPSPDGKKRVYTKIKEDYISEVKEKEEDRDKKLDIRKGVKNKVKVFPEVKEQVEEKPKRVDPAQKRAQMQKVNLLQRKIQAIRSGSGSDIMASYEAEGEQIDEKAVSKAQQRFMGMVYAAKKGETPASPEVAKAAAGISKKEAKKFAGTKHSKLPEKVAEEKEKCDCGKTPCECDERENPTKMDLLKNKMRAKGIKVASITPSPRNMKTYDELGEAAEDRARDEHQMRGGMAARKDYDRPPAKKLSNKELGIRDFTPAEKAKRAKEMSAHLKKMK
jgi:hypothetical protein